MADPPPYQEAAQCSVCNCNFTTFKRRVWIVHMFVCVCGSLSLSMRLFLSRCRRSLLFFFFFLVFVLNRSTGMFCFSFEAFARPFGQGKNSQSICYKFSFIEKFDNRITVQHHCRCCGRSLCSEHSTNQKVQVRFCCFLTKFTVSDFQACDGSKSI